MKQLFCLSSLVILCAFVTGCPSNDYTIELKPQPDCTLERTLTFYRADGSDSNGIPNYAEFPSNELISIVSAYPVGAVKTNGLCYTATADFAGVMPQDIGGAGAYTNFTTRLGEAGFYQERFRGTNDLAGQMARRFAAADQVDDLMMGWTKMQFGHEPGYKNLRKFLGTDFRQDLKNAGLYAWAGEVNNLSDTNNPNEFIFRFFQYLHERGYLKLSDTRDIYLLVANDADASITGHLLQRLISEKMNRAASTPLPPSFAVLGDSDALQQSWEKYLADTDLYRARLKQWESETNADSNIARPKPEDVADDAVKVLVFGNVDEGFGGTPDHLTVKLTLPHAPDFTNGKWQDGRVVWSADLDPGRPLPAFCYAGWSNPNTSFQSEHFGRVILDNAALSQYCFWQGSLGAEQNREWDSFVAGLKPGPELATNLAEFQFSGEANLTTNKGNQIFAYVGRKLLLDALGNETGK